MPPQAAPATTSYVLGLGGKPGDRVLAVANPGDDEVRVALRVVTQESEFTPSRLEELTVPPGATTSVDLTGVLRGDAARGAIGLRLDSSLPVTASLRTLASGDLSHAVAARAERRDPPTKLLELARDLGCLFSIDSERPRPGQLDMLDYERPGDRGRHRRGPDRHHVGARPAPRLGVRAALIRTRHLRVERPGVGPGG